VVLYGEHKSFPEIAALLGTSRQNVQQILEARRDRLFRWGQEQA
jgi:DNA-directed RNA polymerase specialized sigma subunit